MTPATIALIFAGAYLPTVLIAAFWLRFQKVLCRVAILLAGLTFGFYMAGGRWVLAAVWLGIGSLAVWSSSKAAEARRMRGEF